MDAIFAWLRPQLRLHRRQVLVLIVFVGVATAVVLTAAAGARRTDTAFDRLLDATAASEVRVQYSTTADVHDEVLGRFRSHPDVDLAVPVYITPVLTDRSDYEITVLSSPDGAFLHDIDRVRITSGRLPRPGAAAEVVTSEFIAGELDLRIGDTMPVATFTQRQLEEESYDDGPKGPLLDLTLVGVAVTVDQLIDEETPFLYAGGGDAEAEHRRAGAWGPTIELLLQEGADADAVVESVMSGIPVEEATQVEAVDARSARVRDATRVLAMGLVAFAASAALAGLVACGQAVARLLAAFSDDQVALQAMGFTRGQRFAAVMAATVPIAVGGALLGVVLAVAVSPLMPIGIARRAEPSPGLDVDWLVLGPVAVAAVVLLVAATMVTALRISDVGAAATPGPRDAGRIRRSAGAATAARAGWSPASVLGITMALEPGRGRTSVPVRPALVGAIAGVAGVVAALTFGAGVDHLVSTPAAYGWNWSLRPDVDIADGELEVLAGLPEVSDAGMLFVRQSSVNGRQVDGAALRTVKGSPSLTVLHGRMPAGPGEVSLGPKTADELGVEIGDHVTAQAEGGDVDLEVVGEVLFPVLDDGAFNEGIAFHPDLVGSVELSDGFEGGIVDFAEGVSEADGVAAVTEALPGSVSVYAFPSRPGDIANLADVSSMPFALAAFLVVVALAAVAHTLITSVRRRARDLAVARSLGFVRRDVRGSITVQSLTLVVIGLVVGVPLGIALGRSIWAVVAGELGVAPSPQVPMLALALVLLGALAAALATAVWPARQAILRSPADVLRAE